MSWRPSRRAGGGRCTPSSAARKTSRRRSSVGSRSGPSRSWRGEPMESRPDGNTILLKLSDGEDLVPSLEAAARKHDVESGAVLWGIGMIQDFEIGVFGPKGYEATAV